MTDDHDRCEWVNVFSGIGSPRLPRQNPESRKTVVCVCVCVIFNRVGNMTYNSLLFGSLWHCIEPCLTKTQKTCIL